MNELRLRRFTEGLLDDANRSGTLAAFRHALVARTDALIGADTATVLPAALTLGGDDSQEGAVARDLSTEVFDHYLSNRTRFWGQLPQVPRAMAEHGGLLLDTDIFSSRERHRLPIYAESLVPLGITSILCATLAFRGRTTGVLCLNRHGGGRDYHLRHVERLRPVLSILGMADAAVAARLGSTTSHAPTPALSPRERDVARLIQAGLQNKEIAAVLGTSLDTVRK